MSSAVWFGYPIIAVRVYLRAPNKVTPARACSWLVRPIGLIAENIARDMSPGIVNNRKGI